MMRLDELLKQTDKETTLLILICRIYLETSNHEELSLFIKENSADLNFDRFYELSKTHRIRPLVYKVLSGADTALLPGLITKLESDCRTITFRALNNLKEMFRVVSALKGKGIIVLPYRGPLFSRMYYGDWSMRESSDLDFLIDKKEIKALEFLKDEGYKAKHVYNDYRDEDIHQNSQSIDLNNDVGGKRNIHLEFHYNIVAACYGLNSGYTDARKNTAEFNTGGKTIDVLSHESTAGIILAHHGLQDIWGSLKYYMDLAVIAKEPGQTDWNQIGGFTRKHGFHKLSAAAFHNMEVLTGVKDPFNDEPVESEFTRRLLDLCLLPEKYEDKGFYKLKLRVEGRDTFAWKSKMIKGLLTLFMRPTTDDFEWKYFPPYVFWLYYVCKPPRLIYTYLVRPLIGKKAVFPFR